MVNILFFDIFINFLVFDISDIHYIILYKKIIFETASYIQFYSLEDRKLNSFYKVQKGLLFGFFLKED
ncbi:hypothetical protein N568_0101070 [Lactococcus garvieae TRF1]|uniref:Uncharacterized protein n=1 Tax=Lactococcus garvieae TRF1 TaxID=1380772 RepID=V8AS76_9LACT|nr:hypothetical protein N568_0101070 [Lactococcus garvieae TRF1]